MGKFRDPYRPERHYMRGPGPKWHAKHAAALISAAGAQRDTGAKVQRELPLAIWAIPWAIPATAAVLLGFMAVVTLT
ncbi:MAG: hypothetical protein MUP20_07070 [Methyloceanibacter sp.]|nr:hypothetical protein [Methyloceanibacter sp.]